MSVIYLILAGGVLGGPITLVDVPGIGCQVPDNAVELDDVLVKPADGFVWALMEGEPQLLADHRGTVYSVITGEAQLFDALGELPEGLTLDPPPGPFYVWQAGKWQLDVAAQERDQALRVQGERDARLFDAQLRIAPLQYASDMHIATEQEKEALLAWMRYSVEVNRVEQQLGYPLTIVWPVSPA